MTDCMVATTVTVPPPVAPVVVSDDYCLVARKVIEDINNARRANSSKDLAAAVLKPTRYYKDGLGEHAVFANGKDFIASLEAGLTLYKE